MTSTYWKNHIMNDVYKREGAEFWIGLSSSEPTVAGSGVTEPSGSVGYRRVQIPRFSNPSNGRLSNADSITFPKSTGVWFPDSAKAAYWVLFDGQGAGAHVLCWGNLITQIAVLSYSTVTIPGGTVRISCSDPS